MARVEMLMRRVAVEPLLTVRFAGSLVTELAPLVTVTV
jgi:hypothetical protein